jgi:hypothetical protein
MKLRKKGDFWKNGNGISHWAIPKRPPPSNIIVSQYEPPEPPNFLQILVYYG